MSLPAAPGGGPVRITCPSCNRTFSTLRSNTATSQGGSATAPAAPSGPAASGSGVPGTHIGPYEILGVLGRGGMGVVYKARDAALDRYVAVKTLLPALAGERDARERFLREARSAAALNHPNLAQIYSIGDEQGTPYFAMEFIEGETLEKRLERRGRLRPLEAVRLIRQVATGLQEAHRIQLIHRDIKPSNLILARDGTLKITDFGLAKRAAGNASLQITQTGEAIGSPQYMSPEQVRGAEVDHRCDIYSLGATFFHLITGRPPFQGTNPVEVAMKHLQETVPSPRTLVKEISYPLAGLVQRMLRKRPGDRPAGYPVLIQELDRIESLETGKAQEPEAVALWIKERRSSSRAGVIGFLALCLAAGFMGFRMVRGFIAEPGNSALERKQTRPFEIEAAQADEGPTGNQDEGTRSGWPSRVRERNLATRRAQEARRPLAGGNGRGGSGIRSRPVGEARLKLRDLVRSSLPPSGTRVEGRIVNQGGGSATNIRVNLNLYDENENLIESSEIRPEQETIERGQATRFEAEFPDLEDVARVEAELSWTY
ncbi:MAG: protein kinase [Acidobacteriota bacterium]